MKKITIAFLVLVMVGSLANVAMACKGKHGHHHKGKFFTYMDTDNDEKITSAEMTDHAVKMFKEHDANKDGVITLSEVKKDVASKFTKIDTDKDGFVNKDELKSHWKEKGKEYHKSK